MANKRHKPEEIVQKLRQVDVLVGQGVQRVDAIREVRITEQTYYRWRKQYGGMGTDQLKELKRLQKENERLRKAVSDLTSDRSRGGRGPDRDDAVPYDLDHMIGKRRRAIAGKQAARLDRRRISHWRYAWWRQSPGQAAPPPPDQVVLSHPHAA